MDIKRNLSQFREFIKGNFKNALIYSNGVSKYASKSFRGEAFKIKSDLAHDVDKDEYLYIPVNLGRVITRIFKDYVIGMGYNVDFGSTDEINEKFVEVSDKIQLQLKLDEGVNNQSSIGYGILRLRNIEGTPRVEVIPLPNYVANMEGLQIGDTFEDIKEHFIFSANKDENGKLYYYVDRYEKQPNGKWVGYYGEKWENKGDFMLANRIEEAQEEEPLDSLPLYILNNDLDNPNFVTDDVLVKNVSKSDIGIIPRFFHQSDYVDLADLFQELNDRGSQISVEFIKNLTSKISVPAGFRDAQTMQALKNGKDKQFAKNPDYLVHNPGEEPARYITKDATYVQTSINDYLPYLLKMVGFIASIPSSLLANAIYWANNPVGTTEKEFMPFYARVESKQQRMYNSLQRLFRDIMVIMGYAVELPTIKFKKPASYDIAERTNTAIMQLNAGIMSKSSAIAFTMGYDESEVNEEMEKIAEEEQNAYAKYNANKVEFEEEQNNENNENNEEQNEEEQEEQQK